MASTVESTNWFRKLRDDRLEVSLRYAGIKVRASGPEEQMWKLVEWFEDATAAEVTGEWRRPPRTGSRPIAGQLDLMERLESDDGD